MPTSCESVTVTVLPDVLALVHIPRSRLKALSHHVVKQILTPSPSFLNITCNKIELSLFADQCILSEFEPLARRDRQRVRRSVGSKRARCRSHSFRDPVEVSYDTWNVLQIDSHDDRQDRAGARVRELSAPLAGAGLSILYQSSYMSDFIFVKSSRLSHVLIQLARAGFVEYAVDLNSQTLPICPSGKKDHSLIILDPKSDTPGSDSTVRRRSTDAGSTSLVLQRDEMPIPESESSGAETQTVTPTPPPSTLARRTSISPCVSDVHILEPPLACVGLSDACADTWASKIIKLVAYPELIDSTVSLPSSEAFIPESYDNLEPMTPLDEGEIRIPFDKNMPLPAPIVPIIPDAWSSSASFPDSTSSLGTSPSSSEDDGYFSSASLYLKSAFIPSLLSSSRSYPELGDSSSALSAMMHYHPRRLGPLGLDTEPPNNLTPSVANDPHEMAVPFFSFTRTAEGSSLTTAVSLIAKLFPPRERHMIICSDDLGIVDENNQNVWKQFHSGAPPPVSSTMKCLQIDLQRYGLDKHGLISRFSKILDSNGINHMYNSTFKTANLLVDKADALRAQSLLRSC